MVLYNLMLGLFLFGAPTPVYEHRVKQWMTEKECNEIGEALAQTLATRAAKKWPAMQTKVDFDCVKVGFGA